jgi:maltose 6'-phosphate phosphatase
VETIQLLYVENTVSRKKHQFEQTLVFYMLVNSLDFHKQVDVLWAGSDGVWHEMAASFHHNQDGQEFWILETHFAATSARVLPKNIRFGLRYRVLGQEFWDNRNGENYFSAANSGLHLAQHIPVLNLDYQDELAHDQSSLAIKVAVDAGLGIKKVAVLWTKDNWHTSHKVACQHSKLAQRPHHHSAQLWTANLKVSNAFRLQYCLVAESKHHQYWDNHFGRNYAVSRNPLKILILNLHCYQESNQDFKLSQIAKAITEQQADIVCLQEVAEHWNDGQGDWPSNSARIIHERLPEGYHIYTDWSHLGFDKYREGVAILSRLPIIKHDSRYVSDSHDIYSIHSRKVVMAQVRALGIGLINVFSAHLSWWEDGFAEQFKRLSDWAAEKQAKSVKATLLCGDFNIEAGSKGYDLVVKANEYDDQFLAANSQGVFEKIFKVHDLHWQHYLSDDYRIDYIFMDNKSPLQVISAAVLFTDQDYGRVSDHCGYLMAFEPRGE